MKDESDTKYELGVENGFIKTEKQFGATIKPPTRPVTREIIFEDTEKKVKIHHCNNTERETQNNP